MEDDQEAPNDGYFKPFKNAEEEMLENSKNSKMKPEETQDAVYSGNKTISGVTENNIAFPLSYGSADL